MDSKLFLSNLALRRRCFFLTDSEFLDHLMRHDSAAPGDFVRRVTALLAGAATSGDECFLAASTRRLSAALQTAGVSATSATYAWSECLEALLCGLEVDNDDDDSPEWSKKLTRQLLGRCVREFYAAGHAFYLARETSEVERAGGFVAKREREDGDGQNSIRAVRVTWSIAGTVPAGVYNLLNPL